MEILDVLKEKNVSLAPNEAEMLKLFGMTLDEMDDKLVAEFTRMAVVVCAYRSIGENAPNVSHEIKIHAVKRVLRTMLKSLEK